MKTVVTHWMKGDGKAPSEASRVENPPVDMVVKAWFTGVEAAHPAGDVEPDLKQGQRKVHVPQELGRLGDPGPQPLGGQTRDPRALRSCIPPTTQEGKDRDGEHDDPHSPRATG